MNSEQLAAELEGFTGTEKWRPHFLNRRLLWTDGVQYFAEKAGAHWFIDLVAIGADGKPGLVPRVVPDKHGFAIVLLTSKDGTGLVEAYADSEEDGTYFIGNRLFTQPIEFTDCPEGVWRFYLVWDGEHTVLLVPSEY
jgi:hypothetical protein